MVICHFPNNLILFIDMTQCSDHVQTKPTKMMFGLEVFHFSVQVLGRCEKNGKNEKAAEIILNWDFTV